MVSKSSNQSSSLGQQRGRISEPRAKTNIITKNAVLIMNQKTGGMNGISMLNGANQPPKNSVTINAEIKPR